MPRIREMYYDLTDRDKPKIKHFWRWWPKWLWLRRIKKMTPITGLPSEIEGWFKFKKKK